jgi:NADH-quinone oxidoreductase subunit N
MMGLEKYLLMRHELVLTIIMLIILIAELSVKGENSRKLRPFSIILFFIATVIGFFPLDEGSLFGGMYQTSGLIAIMKNVLNIGVLIIFIQSYSWLGNDENKIKVSEFFMLMISTLIGMDFMISSGDFLMFYIGLELATIPIASLAAYERKKSKSAEAGIKLILMSALSSGILLYGVSMIYGTTGSIYFSEVAKVYTSSNLQTLAFIFFFAGMAFKISIVPFHLWTADVYEGAPISVTSYLSVISKGAAVFIFIIILFTVFRTITAVWQDVLYITAVLTMTVGNLFAIRQKNLKRFLAFSSISQAGFIFLGIIGGNKLGMTSVVYFMLIYIFSNLGAFGVISAIANKTGKEYMQDYDGLYLTNPKLSLIMMLSLFSLAGIPPVAGFFGKFFLFTAAAEQGYFVLVLIAVLNTIISLYYYLLIVKAMFINKSENPIQYFKSDGYTKLGLLICVAGIIATGFFSVVFEYIRSFSFGI